MKLYLRCVWANKGTLIGWMSLLASPFAYFIFGVWTSFLLLEIGVVLLSVTIFGISTRWAYIRTIKHIKKFGDTDILFEQKFNEYCDRAGLKAAKKDLCI